MPLHSKFRVSSFRFQACLQLHGMVVHVHSWTSALLAVSITPTITAALSKGLPALPTKFAERPFISVDPLHGGVRRSQLSFKPCPLAAQMSCTFILDPLRSVQFRPTSGLVLAPCPDVQLGLLKRWGTHACPQCLPSDTVPIRRTDLDASAASNPPQTSAVPCHAMPCRPLAVNNVALLDPLRSVQFSSDSLHWASFHFLDHHVQSSDSHSKFSSGPPSTIPNRLCKSATHAGASGRVDNGSVQSYTDKYTPGGGV